MAEWSIASVLKTEVLKGTGGSNPSLSAKKKERFVCLSLLKQAIVPFSLNKVPAAACWVSGELRSKAASESLSLNKRQLVGFRG